MRHKHADLIHAWAEGAEIQYKDSTSIWRNTQVPGWHTCYAYRIKPKEKVKKWRWVIWTPAQSLSISINHFATKEEAQLKLSGYRIVEAIKATEIEGEE